MGSVPGWVFFNAAMMLAVGGYVWWRLVVGTTRPRTTARRVGTGAAAVVAISGPIALLGQYALPIDAQRIIGWPGWLGYAFVIFLGTLTVITEPVRIVLWFRRRRARREAGAVAMATGPPADLPVTPTARDGSADQPAHDRALDRRLFLNRVMAAGIVVVASTVTAVAARSAIGGPAVRTATIRLRNLPPQAVGMRIALVSDLHLGSITSRDFCQQVVDLVNAQNPDLICIAGDLADGTAAELSDAVQPLAQLRAPDGIFFATGNHEFYFDPDGWLELLPTLGMRVLANEAETVRGLLVAGVHDIAGAPSGRGPDMDAALAGRVDGQPVIMISHSPSLVFDARDRGVDLMVSGHTHGGQFYPGAWIIALTQPVLSGLAEFGGTQVFVTNGAGFWGPLARLGAPPDITMIELVATP